MTEDTQDCSEDEFFDFGKALVKMKSGYSVARQGWNGKGMYIELQEPTKLSKMTSKYIFMKTADNKLTPWVCSQTDMLAVDWVIVI